MAPQQEISPGMWQEIVERLAAVETTLESYAKTNSEMEMRQTKMFDAIQKITGFMERMNGGVRVVLWMGGAMAGTASFFAWLVGHVSFKP